ncbi:hypothetical protein AB870_06120 [Pandoraea faecigallinarum]|uniref:Uncharacterized protein n=1 Tax=Pandoraea faecigallinarum TaxID=656179 RepID=A0A0H3WNY7_9BURK|nr:hypothetical protein AB870_06120 [Pandoraea faecigallinarum]
MIRTAAVGFAIMTMSYFIFVTAGPLRSHGNAVTGTRSATRGARREREVLRTVFVNATLVS